MLVPEGDEITVNGTLVASQTKLLKVAVEKFQSVTYDIMDVGARGFDDDFYQFRCSIKDLDRRLGSILATGFEDLDTIQGRLKLFDGFEGLLERSISK